MDSMDNNPLLQNEDYMAEYRKNIDKLKNNPEVVMFDKLCYELFEVNETGKRFIKYVEETFLIPGLGKLGSPTYQIDIIWAEGYKDAYRKIKASLIAHKQRIKAEADRNVGATQ